MSVGATISMRGSMASAMRGSMASAMRGSMASAMRGSGAGAMAMAGAPAAPGPWAPMPGQTWPGAAASFLGMWVVMMAAMMLPSLLSVLASYRRAVLALGAAGPGLVAALAGVGYFLVWGSCGAVAYPLGAAFVAGSSQWPAAARSAPVLTGLALLLAGLFQMTRWKASHLERCRSVSSCGPAPTGRAWGAWRFGLRLGFHCTLCCVGLMVSLLVTGVMELGVMAAVACAITLERLAPWPRLAARAGGAVLLGAGALAVARALGP